MASPQVTLVNQFLQPKTDLSICIKSQTAQGVLVTSPQAESYQKFLCVYAPLTLVVVVGHGCQGQLAT